MNRRRAAAGAALVAVALGAVLAGRRAPMLSDDAPAYRRMGPAAAPVTITEYSDFQCPKCAEAQAPLKNLMTRYAGRVRLVFRHSPLNQHRWALDAARAAEAAGLQGRFWEYADVLYTRQAEWSASADPAPLWARYAADVGLDAARFQVDRQSAPVAEAVAHDKALSEAMPVPATPTFLINRRLVVGESQLESFGARFIERELAP